MKRILLALAATSALLVASCANDPNKPSPTGSITNITQVVISATIAACGYQPIAGPALNAVIAAAFGAAPAAGVAFAVDMLCKAAPLFAAAPGGTQSRRVMLPGGRTVIVKGIKR
jgi:hypothetical protein